MTEAEEMVAFAETALQDIQSWQAELDKLQAMVKKTKKDKDRILNLQYEIDLVRGDLRSMGF